MSEQQGHYHRATAQTHDYFSEHEEWITDNELTFDRHAWILEQVFCIACLNVKKAKDLIRETE